jgi:hypothetical protein
MELEMSIFGFWSRLYHGRWDLDWERDGEIDWFVYLRMVPNLSYYHLAPISVGNCINYFWV